MNNIWIRIEIRTNLEQYQEDILIYMLGNIGFQGFEQTSYGITAYIREIDFNEQKFISLMPKKTRYRIDKITYDYF